MFCTLSWLQLVEGRWERFFRGHSIFQRRWLWEAHQSPGIEYRWNMPTRKSTMKYIHILTRIVPFNVNVILMSRNLKYIKNTFLTKLLYISKIYVMPKMHFLQKGLISSNHCSWFLPYTLHLSLRFSSMGRGKWASSLSPPMALLPEKRDVRVEYIIHRDTWQNVRSNLIVTELWCTSIVVWECQSIAVWWVG